MDTKILPVCTSMMQLRERYRNIVGTKKEIQSRMYKSKDGLRKIKLGKSFSGKEITLADIWEDSDQRDVD